MKVTIGFICVGNSCRSQMAEGFTKHYGERIFKVYSAGTHPSFMVSSDAVAVMNEKNIDIGTQYPKSLGDIPDELDILVTMGCEVECPYLPAGHMEDWGIDDPVGMSLSEFRGIRDIIENKVIELVDLAKDSDSKENFFDKLKQR